METLKVLYNMEAKIVNRRGHGIGGRIFFEAVANKKMTNQDLQLLQRELGYHPAGYDFFSPSFSQSINDKGFYTASWSCSASCD